MDTGKATEGRMGVTLSHSSKKGCSLGLSRSAPALTLGSLERYSRKLKLPLVEKQQECSHPQNAW